MNRTSPLISVCIITYKRPKQLLVLLDSLALQTIHARYVTEIIVVDNDAKGSAERIVKEFTARNPDIAVTYEIEPLQGIPLARNHSVRLAKGVFIAFIDDDEKADKQWLEALHKCITKYDADAVFGPVEPILPEDCPSWLKKGDFYNRPHHEDGSPLVTGRTGNALVRKIWLDRFESPFDPALRFTGGSDSDFFGRILRQGAKLCWAERAIVYEFVGPERLKLKWLLMRAFRGGQGYARTYLANKNFAIKIFHIVYRLSLCGLALAMVPISFPFGFHHGIWWLRKVFSNAGQLTAYTPFQYEEYKPERYR